MSKIMSLDVGLSKLYAIKDRGVILVDSGCYADKSFYKEKFAEMGFEPSEVKLIVVTHGHWDHISRVADVKELTGAPVLCHKNAVQALLNGDKMNYVPRGEDGKKFVEMISQDKPDTFTPVQPNIVIEDNFDLKPYGVDGKLIHTPGHSDCSISVVLDSGEAIVGDMILNSPFDGKPCLALIANDEPKLMDSLKVLLKNADLFYGGHGGPYTKEEISRLVYA